VVVEGAWGARGETALYDAVTEALDHIRRSPLQKKVLIVLSDGGDNRSTHSYAQALRMLQESNVIVYTVGLFDEYDIDSNPRVLKRLAKASGGEAFFPKEIAAVTGVLQAVSRDIRNQYTVGYVPSNGNRDGSYRTISVTLAALRADRWTVRTRAGYVASKDVER
jgi:Ca-activated chloride channel family protein